MKNTIGIMSALALLAVSVAPAFASDGATAAATTTIDQQKLQQAAEIIAKIRVQLEGVRNARAQEHAAFSKLAVAIAGFRAQLEVMQQNSVTLPDSITTQLQTSFRGIGDWLASLQRLHQQEASVFGELVVKLKELSVTLR